LRTIYKVTFEAVVNRNDLPDELFNLDILDGSPPCTTFSMSGKRELTWGKEKKFTEGQILQRLDDLVFCYCDTIKKLKPKICILENVYGIIKGNAKWYSKKIIKYLETNYNVQVFLLDSATMGVPQRRQRVFFIGRRKDLKYPELKLDFNIPIIPFGKIRDMADNSENLTPMQKEQWENRKYGDKNFSEINVRMRGKDIGFSWIFRYDNKVSATLVANTEVMPLFDVPRNMNKTEMI